MSGKIFGYDWEDIQRAQKGGRLHKPVDTSKPAGSAPTQQDLALLAEHGEDGLRRLQFFGALDRLARAGLVSREGE